MVTNPSHVALDDLQLSDLQVEELTPEEVSKLRSTTVGTGDSSSVKLFETGAASASGSSVWVLVPLPW